MTAFTSIALLALLLAAQAPRDCTVSRIVDGDTFECREGIRVRLLTVDAP